MSRVNLHLLRPCSTVTSDEVISSPAFKVLNLISVEYLAKHLILKEELCKN